MVVDNVVVTANHSVRVVAAKSPDEGPEAGTLLINHSVQLNEQVFHGPNLASNYEGERYFLYGQNFSVHLRKPGESVSFRFSVRRF